MGGLRIYPEGTIYKEAETAVGFRIFHDISLLIIKLTMKFDKFGSVAFFISSVSADFFTARSLDHGQNVDLGYLEDVNGFYSVIGHDMHSNETYWEDATIWETFEQEETQSPNSAASINTGLNRRSDMCEDLTGITKFLCENVTSRYWFWGAGGALIMYYLPQAMTNWLNVRSSTRYRV